MTKKNEWQERAARLFCAAVAVVAAYLAIQYCAPVLVVFGIALGVAALVYPLSVRTARLLHLPQRLCAVLYVLLLIAALGGAAVLLLVRLGEEIAEVLGRWESGENGIAGAIGRLFDACVARLSRLPLIGSLVAMLHSEHPAAETVSGVLRDALTSLGASCSAAVGRVLRTTPRAVIRVLVTLFATLYLSADFGPLCTRVRACLPPSVGERLDALRTGAGRAVRRYLRAYLLLFLLTFSEALVGLWLLRQPYALLIALGVAIVDLLPVLGAGTVLVPWALVVLVFGNYRLGLGLLILYGVITIVRQIAEPHIVGKSLGLPPVMTLFAVFVGWELFGVLGMLLSPAVALLAKELFCAKRADFS